MANGRAGQEVYMKTDVVRDMAKSFNSIHEFLQSVIKMLDTLTTMLKSTAFIGLVGGYAVIQFMETIKPYIEQTSEKCANMNKELIASVNAYENGDSMGATRFH